MCSKVQDVLREKTAIKIQYAAKCNTCNAWKMDRRNRIKKSNITQTRNF